MNQDLIGKVVHYYDKAGVAIVALAKELKEGDRVKFVKGDNAFEQAVESMQVEHAPVSFGAPGQEVAVKVSQPAEKGTLVYAA